MKPIHCSGWKELPRIKLSGIPYGARIFATCFGFALLLPIAARADVIALSFNGTGGAFQLLRTCTGSGANLSCTDLGPPCTLPAATVSLIGASSATKNCPDLVHKIRRDGTDVEVSRVSATITNGVTESFSGTTRTVTFTGSGQSRITLQTGDPRENNAALQAGFSSSATCFFVVTDKPETITINPTLTVTGKDSQCIVDLDGFTTGQPSTRLGRLAVLETGTFFDTLPRSITLQPGSYTINLDVRGGGLTSMFPNNTNQSGAMNATFNVTLSVTVPSAEYHWKNPDGGNWGAGSNWEPARVPDAGKVAVFNLAPGAPNPVPVTAQNNIVGQMIISRMPIRLTTGPLGVIGTSPNTFNFSVRDGGSLRLDNGASLKTQDGSIGDGAGESSVVISGEGTIWTNSTFRDVVIGNKAPGRLVVENDASFMNRANLIVGQDAVGTLRFESGGHGVAERCTVAKGSSLEVRGTGPSQTYSALRLEKLEVGGTNGNGTVLIENGGWINTLQTVKLSGSSRITISGVGVGSQLFRSRLLAAEDLEVRGDASGQVEVKDGALLDVEDRNISIGYFGTSQRGKLLVHGKGGATNATCKANNLAIYNGELEVTDGGRIAARDVTIATGAQGDISNATVSGSDSRLSVPVTGRLWVGGSGRGTLTISSGALVESGTAKVGESLNGLGTGSGLVNITAGFSSAEWHVFGNCDVGIDESGIINLNRAPLFGPEAKLTVDAYLTVGPRGLVNGNGTLTAGQIINNGVVAANLLPAPELFGLSSAGRVINNKALSAGLPPGSLEINGNYQQGPGGILRIEIAGLNQGQFAVIQISGDATLAGRVELSFTQGFVPKPGDRIEFLQVNGKAAGTLEVVPLFVPADPTAGRPALAVQGSWTMTADGKGSLTVTDVRPTVQLNVALEPLAVGKERKVNLSFLPVAGQNHSVEFADSFGAGSIWQPLPGAPHNSGLISNVGALTARFYRVRVGN